MYKTAVDLCDALMLAIQERERESASLADTRSKAYSVALAENKKKEEAEKRRFFESGIIRRWLRTRNRIETESLIFTRIFAPKNVISPQSSTHMSPVLKLATC